MNNKIFVDMYSLIVDNEMITPQTSQCKHQSCITLINSWSMDNGEGYCCIHCRPAYKTDPDNNKKKVRGIGIYGMEGNNEQV